MPRVKAALLPFEASHNKSISIIDVGRVHTGGDIHRLLHLLIDSPMEMAGRAIRKTFITDSEAGQRLTFRWAYLCLASCIAQDAHYCLSIALKNARKGILVSGLVFAGANVHRIGRIVTAAS